MTKIIKAFLKQNKIICLDVGAKGGALHLNQLNNFCTFYGFEPNPSEYLKLIQTNSEKYFSYGISGTGGEKDFFITNHASYSSLLKCDFKNLRKHFGKVKDYSKWVNAFEIEKTEKIKTKTLEQFILEENLESIDFLKLDTQGTELDILKGAKSLLQKKNISVIFAEVLLIDVYKNQNSFSELDQYLKNKDYEFIDCRFYPEYITNDLFLKSKYEKSRFSVGGDAIYAPKLKSIANDKLQCFKVGLILSSMRYLSISSTYLEHCGLKDKDIINIHAFTNLIERKKVIKNIVPPFLLHLIKKITLKKR